MSCAICNNLDQSKILSPSNGLKDHLQYVTIMIIIFLSANTLNLDQSRFHVVVSRERQVVFCESIPYSTPRLNYKTTPWGLRLSFQLKGK